MESVSDRCACLRRVRKLAAGESQAELRRARGKFVNAPAEMSRGSRGLGVWRKTTAAAFPEKSGVSLPQAAELPGLGSESCLQPSPAVEGGWCAGSSCREVLTRTCCLVAQIISAFWLLREIWPLGFAFSFIYFSLFSILFVNTNILSHPERFLPSLKIPSSSPSTACRLFPAPASPYALCCTYLALSVPSLVSSCSVGARIPSATLNYHCTFGSLHNLCSSPELFYTAPGYFSFPAFGVRHEAVVDPSPTAALLRAGDRTRLTQGAEPPEPLVWLCYPVSLTCMCLCFSEIRRCLNCLRFPQQTSRTGFLWSQN